MNISFYLPEWALGAIGVIVVIWLTGELANLLYPGD